MSEGNVSSDMLALTAQIVAAHVSHNNVAAAALPSLIEEVHRTLKSIEAPPAPRLAPDYPMVAPRYAQHRSTLAKKIGLGTKPRKRRRSRS